MQYPPTFHDDLQPGMVFTAVPRTVRREDIGAFAQLSGDLTRLHTDDAYAATTPFGRIVSHGALNLAVATGLAYSLGIFDGTVLAVRSMDVAFDRPVFPGDSLTLKLSVKHVQEAMRADRGGATFEVDLSNQYSRTVLSGTWSVLMRRAGSSSDRSGA